MALRAQATPPSKPEISLQYSLSYSPSLITEDIQRLNLHSLGFPSLHDPLDPPCIPLSSPPSRSTISWRPEESHSPSVPPPGGCLFQSTSPATQAAAGSPTQPGPGLHPRLDSDRHFECRRGFTASRSLHLQVTPPGALLRCVFPLTGCAGEHLVASEQVVWAASEPMDQPVLSLLLSPLAHLSPRSHVVRWRPAVPESQAATKGDFLGHCTFPLLYLSGKRGRAISGRISSRRSPGASKI